MSHRKTISNKKKRNQMLPFDRLREQSSMTFRFFIIESSKPFQTTINKGIKGIDDLGF